MKKEYYTTSLQHILAELERVDLLIQIQIRRARQVHMADSEFQGLCISEQEIDALPAQPFGMPCWATTPGPLSSESPLLKYYLFHLFDDPSYRNPPLLSKYLKVDERVVNYLFGSDEIDTRLQTCTRLSEPQTCFSTSDIKTLSLSCESCGCQKNTPFVIDGS